MRGGDSREGLRLTGYVCITLAAGALFQFARVAGLYADPTARLVLLALFALGGMWLVFSDTFGALCVVLALMPFTREVGQIEVGVVTLNPFTIGIIVLSLVALGAMATGHRFRLGLMDLMTAGVCLLYAATTLLSPTLIKSGFLAFHSLFIPVLAYVTLRVLAPTRKRAMTCLGFMMAGILAFDLACLAQFAAVQERVYLMRVQPVGVALLTLLPICFLFYTDKLRPLPRRVLLVVALATFAVTFSRVLTLTLLASPLLVRWLRRGHARALYLWLMGLSLAATLALSVIVPMTLGEQSLDRDLLTLTIESRRQEQGAARMFSPALMMRSMELRAMSYWQGLLEFADHPVFGVGLEQGEEMVTQHNVHIEWLQYGGVVGYFLYFSLLLAFFDHFRTAARDPVVAVCVLMVFFVLVNAMTNGIMHGFSSYLPFIFIGLCHGLAAGPERGAGAEGAR